MLPADMKKVPWQAMLEEALNRPGMLASAYHLFHTYSLGNQILAAIQLGDKLGPIATYKRWSELGRQVKKGEKAIALYMPVAVKDDRSANADAADDDEQHAPRRTQRVIFLLRRRWFSLAQTEGPTEPEFPPSPAWSLERALRALEIERIPFDDTSGNRQGFARPTRRQIAVSPIAAYPYKTAVHEMAHVLLHGEAAEFAHSASRLPRSVEEAEAEAVAFIVVATLGLHGEDALSSARAYIQGWLSDPEARAAFAKKHAARVFGAAQRILRAGQEQAAEEDSEPFVEAEVA